MLISLSFDLVIWVFHVKVMVLSSVGQVEFLTGRSQLECLGCFGRTRFFKMVPIVHSKQPLLTQLQGTNMSVTPFTSDVSS